MARSCPRALGKHKAPLPFPFGFFLPMESSSHGKPNFMQQLFARNPRRRQQEERKRSRHQHPVDLPVPPDPIVTTDPCGDGGSDGGSDGGGCTTQTDVTMQQDKTMQPAPSAPLGSGKRHLQRMEASRKRHHKAMELEREYPVVVRAKRMATTSASPLQSPQSPQHLAIHCLDPPLDPWNQCLPRLLLILALNLQCSLIVETCPSYDQLRAQLVTERFKCRALSEEYARIRDRFLRFQQHVESRRDQYLQLPLEGVGKPNRRRRRVTASPARILQQQRDAPGLPPRTDDRCATVTPATEASSHVPLHPSRPIHPFPTTHVPRTASSTPLPMATHTTLPSWATPVLPSPQPPTSTTTTTGTTAPHDDSQTIVPAILEPVSLFKKDRLSTRSQPPHHDTATRMVDTYSDPPPTSTTEPASNLISTQILPQKKLQDDKNHAPHNPKTGSGWMSTRHAKAFVAEVDNSKQRPQVGPPPPLCPPVPPFKPQGIAHRLSNSSKHHNNDDDFLDGSPPPNDRKPNEQQQQPYLEVVRNKQERDRLNRYECVECGKFIQAICDQDSQGVYDRHALLCHSRHRARFTPPQTPEDFWELSFLDERDAKRRRRLQQKDVQKVGDPDGAATPGS